MLKLFLKRLRNVFKRKTILLLKKIAFKSLSVLHNENKWNKTIKSDKEIIWVFGMIRSGTSLTTQILTNLGADIGPQKDLIQPVGVLKNLNPNGFFENFIFAEYSRYFLDYLNKSGANPPKENEESDVSFKDVDYVKLVYFSLFKINDDRVTLMNKYRAFRKLSKYGIHKYVEIFFKNNATIKIPMLSFFYKQLINEFPNSKFLIVYRNPDSVIKSAKILIDDSKYELYNTYQEYFLKISKNNNVYFFSYDNLLQSPSESIGKLAKYLNLSLDDDSISMANGLIDKKLIRNKPNDQYIGIEKINTTYKHFNELAIN